MPEKRGKKGRNDGKAEIEAMAAKRCRDRGGISFSSEEEENNESNIRDDTDPDQANDKYPL